jgi:predicted unusual protein kinase regulating ubiquinone biosynthesis (AarF/ABC1/UbiB family)
VALVEMNGAALAEEVFRAYLTQVLVDGIFHADPHPGNVFVTNDGRVALLDLGMVGHLTPRMQETLLKVLIAVSEGKAETAADLIMRISETTDDFDAQAFQRRIGQVIADHHDRPLDQLDVGRTLLNVTQTAADTGLYVPSELTLLGHTAAYASLAVLLLRRPTFRRLLLVLAPVGRMPLTTYLCQSVAATFVFYGWGLDRAGRTGAAACLGISLVIFALQIAAAHLWLRGFRFGPAEWLWRTLAYGRRPPMRL